MQNLDGGDGAQMASHLPATRNTKVKELTMPGGVFTAMLPWVPLYLLYGPGGVGRRYRWRARGLTASLARILHCELVEDGAPA